MVVALVLLSGLLSIAVPRPIVTTVGVLFVIIGLMGLMPVVRLWLSNDAYEVIPR